MTEASLQLPLRCEAQRSKEGLCTMGPVLYGGQFSTALPRISKWAKTPFSSIRPLASSPTCSSLGDVLSDHGYCSLRHVKMSKPKRPEARTRQQRNEAANIPVPEISVQWTDATKG
jgi:hypothetical protein